MNGWVLNSVIKSMYFYVIFRFLANITKRLQVSSSSVVLSVPAAPPPPPAGRVGTAAAAPGASGVSSRRLRRLEGCDPGTGRPPTTTHTIQTLHTRKKSWTRRGKLTRLALSEPQSARSGCVFACVFPGWVCRIPGLLPVPAPSTSPGFVSGAANELAPLLASAASPGPLGL